MNRESYSKAATIFQQACELPVAERSAYLRSQCGSDPEMFSYVRTLLAAHGAAGDTFLAKPAVAALAHFLDSSRQVPAPGEKLGNYIVGKEIGAGGMGVVYEARDQRLNRPVALKVLATSAGASHDAVERFQREAQAASALNHPNIVSVFDAGEEGGFCYIATELIVGRTLRQMLSTGPISLQQLLDVAAQTASALSAAHEGGIIHRDIKPENVMVRNDGFVKVLDFGLAKTAPAAAAPPSQETSPGLVPGTIHYLSPEQVLGEPATPRSDLFCLGILLYELATGVRPFDGATQIAVFDAILRQNPRPASQLRSIVGAELDALLERLLEKKPEYRFQTAADVHAAIRRLQRGSRSGSSWASAPHPAESSRRRCKRWGLIAAAPLLFGALVGSIVWLLSKGRSADHAAPASFELLTNSPGEERFPSLSPDGTQFVYGGADRRIYLQRTGGSTPLCLTPEPGSINTQPALSRDGTKIAFRSERNGGGIFVMEITGENVIRVSPKGYLPAWSPDGKSLAYSEQYFETPSARGSPNSRLHILDLETGEDRILVTGDAVQPNWSPHAKRIAYWGLVPGGHRRVFTVSTAGGDPVEVPSAAGLNWHPVWSPDGRSLYFLSDRGGVMNLWRIAIDEKTGRTSGPLEPLTLPAQSIGGFYVSNDGHTLLYSTAHRSSNLFSSEFDLATLELRGAPQPALSGSHYIRNFSFSPDGSQITYDTVGAPVEDLWIINRDGSGKRKLYSHVGKNRAPSWSPAGDDIAFFSGRSGRYEIWIIHPDGSGLRQLTETTGTDLQSPGWSPDGRFIYSARTDGGLYSIPAYRGLSRDPERLLPPGDGESSINRVAPDGTVLTLSAYTSSRLFLFRPAMKKLEDTGYRADPTAWLPDGSGFLFAFGGKCRLYNLRSRSVRTLFDVSPGTIASLGLAAGRIYFTSMTSEGDIWLGRTPTR